MSEPNAPTCGACGLAIHENEMGLRHRGTRTLHSESRCIDLLLQKVDFLKRDVHILEQQRDNALADYNELRKAARNVLQAWDMYGTAECLRGWIDILRKEMEEANA